jgi:hypothetical protein
MIPTPTSVRWITVQISTLHRLHYFGKGSVPSIFERVSKMVGPISAAIPQGLKLGVLGCFLARLKSCPDTKQVLETSSHKQRKGWKGRGLLYRGETQSFNSIAPVTEASIAARTDFIAMKSGQE